MKNSNVKDPIVAPKGTKFLSDIPNFKFPKGIFNKKSTGCGGTHYALINDEPTIVAVPLTTLIQSKEQSKAIKDMGITVFGRYSGHNSSMSELAAYLEEASKQGHAPKLMVTYDSLPRLVSQLERLKQDPTNTYHLLVDEYHMLLTQYDFRGTAIRPLLDLAPTFEYYTLMTATPYKGKVEIPYFKSMDYTEVKWHEDDVMKVKPHLIMTNKPYETLGKQITALRLRKIKGQGEGLDLGLEMNGFEQEAKEMIVFTNSVDSICTLIEGCGLSEDDVDVVCTDNLKNRDKLNKAGISDIAIPKAEGEKNKTFTFCTSKAFVGVDFYSESAVCAVLVDVNKQHTILDIATDLTQIAGRIRTQSNPFRGHVYHFTNPHNQYGKYAQTEEDYNGFKEDLIATTRRRINFYNGSMAIDKESAIEGGVATIKSSNYLFYFNSDKDLFEYDEFAEAILDFNWYNAYEVYKNGTELVNSYSKAGLTAEERIALFTKGKDAFGSATANRIDYLKEYCAAKESNNIELITEYNRRASGMTEVVELYNAVELALLSENGEVSEADVTAFMNANGFRKKRIVQKIRPMLPAFKSLMRSIIHNAVLNGTILPMGNLTPTSDWDQNFVSNADLKNILNEYAKDLEFDYDTDEMADVSEAIIEDGKAKAPKIKASDIEKYTSRNFLKAEFARYTCKDGKRREGYVLTAYNTTAPSKYRIAIKG